MPAQLNLPGWNVVAARPIGTDAYAIDAAYDVYPNACLKCGAIGQLYKHGTKLIRFVDAPIRGRQTFINVKRARYRCRACLGTFMQPLPDMDNERRMTVRCRSYIERQCLLEPNTHVAEAVGVDEKVVRQIGKASAERLIAKVDA
jgi:transposase